mgnify:FL=1
MTMEQNAQPIRVAQMMMDMNYGGVEMVVMNYYRHMDRSRVQFDFFALEGSTLPQREEIEQLGGRVYVVPKYTHLPQYEREIGRLFRQNGYQIVHSHMNTLSVLSSGGKACRGAQPDRAQSFYGGQGRRGKKCDEVPAPSLCCSVSHPALCLLQNGRQLALW